MILDPKGEALRPATRVAVAVIAGDTVPTVGAYSLANLLAATAATRRDVELRLYVDRDPLPSQARQNAVAFAIQAGCTHVLFLSPNVVVPRDTISRLLQEQAAFVAAALVTPEIPSYPMAADRQGDPLYVEEGASGTVEVSHVTLHCALIDLRVFQELPRPWFHAGYNPASGRYVPEELYFTSKVREHGHLVLVDLALSQEVTHLGEMEYRSVHALQSRDLAAADEAPAGGTC